MLQNPDIARGFVKENRQKVAEFWKQLTLALNSVGPPVKTEFEWKKVWTDQKRYVRKKASHNKMHERGTGGEPNRTQTSSSTEEAIYKLLDIKESVDGIETSQCYGLSAKKARVNPNTDDLSEIVVLDEEDPGSSARVSEPPVPQHESEYSPKSSKQPNSATKSKKQTSSELVIKELEIQQ
ncbi:uncharacterized protein LOC129236187 [Anastrepha obliqua]|uniref:uncharacterized protein LOC129236187 n=1 Tax=Anastrepha obliqua TaxID=95512 RepID=UPI0024092930|nr:uncharacterized protein LOC129236187 [Anastrepha obliqua]